MNPPKVWRKWVFLSFAAAFSLVALAPLWASRFLPLLDEPNHLSAMSIWSRLSDPASPLHTYYEARFAPVSYLLHYGLGYLLTPVFGVEIAHKTLLSLYVLSFPAAAILWCRNTGRSVWLSLTVIPLAFSSCWAHGYHPFNAGLAACLLGVVAQDSLLRRVTLRSALLAVFSATACYFGHPLALFMLFVCTAGLWAVHWSGWRSLLISFSTLVPSLLFYRWQSNAAHVGEGALGRMLGPEFPVVSLRAWWAKVVDFAEYAVNPLSGPVDSRTFLGMLGLTAILFGVALRWAHRQRSDRLGPDSSETVLDSPPEKRRRDRIKEGLVHHRGLVLATLLLAFYFILPDHFNEPVYLWIARGRLAPVIAFFLLLSPPCGERSLLRWGAFATAVVGLSVPVRAALAYRGFGRTMASLEKVIDGCPRDAPLLTVQMGGTEKLEPEFDVVVWRHFASWVQVLHGGYSPQWFPRPIPFPFRIVRALPAPRMRVHNDYRKFLDPGTFQCVLTMDFEGDILSPEYTLSGRQGRFALFVVR